MQDYLLFLAFFPLWIVQEVEQLLLDDEDDDLLGLNEGAGKYV